MFSYLLALSPLQKSLLKIDITNGESSTLLDGLTEGPDGIVVDPDRKYAYWTNMGTPGFGWMIVVATMVMVEPP